MPSETERITNEFMDKHDFDGLAGRLGGQYLQKPEGQIRVGDDPQFTNGGYMELERPARDGRHWPPTKPFHLS